LDDPIDRASNDVRSVLWDVMSGLRHDKQQTIRGETRQPLLWRLAHRQSPLGSSLVGGWHLCFFRDASRHEHDECLSPSDSSRAICRLEWGCAVGRSLWPRPARS